MVILAVLAEFLDSERRGEASHYQVRNAISKSPRRRLASSWFWRLGFCSPLAGLFGTNEQIGIGLLWAAGFYLLLAGFFGAYE